ncbi:MAG: hypothetical protein KDC34_10250 [Saprospiraceae bacterium]|nr:hypothetical protein [Saprospiraceae bacterium]
MKYRQLNTDELQELEQEFIQFLASNQITASDWEKLKQNQPEKVTELITLFSDIVFDKILKEATYLEYREARDLKTFYCGPDKIVMLGLYIEGDASLDFTENLPPEEMLAKIQGSSAQLKMYRAEKSYQGEREQELFRMLEGGALISKEGNLFNTLQGLAE